MKSFLANLTMMLPLCLFASKSPPSEAVVSKPESVAYNHRVVIFHPNHHGYEYLPESGLYVGFDVYSSDVYSTTNSYDSFVFSDLRIGMSCQAGQDSTVRPFVGVSIQRNMRESQKWLWNSKAKNFLAFANLDEPIAGYGLLGVTSETSLNEFVSVGVTTKFLAGTQIAHLGESERTFLWGVDMSLPVTVRLGSASHWELKLDPFAVVLNDGSRYVGHRSALAYRF